MMWDQWQDHRSDQQQSKNEGAQDVELFVIRAYQISQSLRRRRPVTNTELQLANTICAKVVPDVRLPLCHSRISMAYARSRLREFQCRLCCLQLIRVCITSQLGYA